jgi:hypothetical protein
MIVNLPRFLKAWKDNGIHRSTRTAAPIQK